jgi:transaldolase/glucose-6-phosphate isomerase
MNSTPRSPVNPQSYRLPPALEEQVARALDRWESDGGSARLWNRDASLWTAGDEGQWMGWLEVVDKQARERDHLDRIARDVRKASFTHALLLGMGGSSLCPEVLARTFVRAEGHPELLVLDSTDPVQVMAIEERLDMDRTLFIVSSKSGTTLESRILKDYFYDRVSCEVGADQASTRFIAITDPESDLDRSACDLGFRHVFRVDPTIGGRFSALSDFGMVPAAVIGLDVERFLSRTLDMVRACGPAVQASDNPGVVLGHVLGVLGANGRNKVTVVASRGIRSLGAWLEQLVAESTGKDEKGLIPIDGEEPGPPDAYGADRVFVYLRLGAAPSSADDEVVEVLERTGQPVVRIDVPDVDRLGQEFFRWEIATAVAGAHMGIHPFDQPDVDASKVASRALTAVYEESGVLPAEEPILKDGGLGLFTDAANTAVLEEVVGPGAGLIEYVRAHLNRLDAGDYFAVLAYLERNQTNEIPLQSVRHLVRDRKRVATCLGFGPRFLHSTGQLHKGGPNAGVFIQVTCDDVADLAVPGRSYTFGVAKAAQAGGDFEVLAARGRRLVRVHLGADVALGLRKLEDVVRGALEEG